jgi:hypothetical protein
LRRELRLRLSVRLHSNGQGHRESPRLAAFRV